MRKNNNNACIYRTPKAVIEFLQKGQPIDPCAGSGSFLAEETKKKHYKPS